MKNNNMTLLIMAAGMGSRFGGLKQIEPVGPNNEFIIDYSIYDAIKAGFNKVVFIIKRENFEVFKETIGSRVEPHIEVKYVFQDMDTIPGFVNRPESRIKPWGTAHAIYAAKDQIHEPFAIINADDFYGRDAYMTISKFLRDIQKNAIPEYAVTLYQVSNTLTENGSVKRGVCNIENGYLKELVESKVERKNDKIIASPLDDSPEFIIEDSHPVSMNMFGFSHEIFDYIGKSMIEFFHKNIDNLDKCEFLIPDVVFDAIENNKAVVRALHTDAVWYGVTYKEDKDMVVNAINNLVETGVYPKDLW